MYKINLCYNIVEFVLKSKKQYNCRMFGACSIYTDKYISKIIIMYYNKMTVVFKSKWQKSKNKICLNSASKHQS